MAKKTRVTLPGSLSDLVKDLQNGGAHTVQQETEKAVKEDDKQSTVNNQAEAKAVEQEQHQSPTPQSPASKEVKNEKPYSEAPQGAADGDKVNEETPADRNYNVIKDDTEDSWQLFLDMAKQYRNGDGKLATIYIDSQLKNILDRMKYAGPEKLSTSAILSSIVARFIYDHEAQIRKALFSGDLI